MTTEIVLTFAIIVALLESRFGKDYDLIVIALLRREKVIMHLNRDTMIRAEDLLLIEGPDENLARAKKDWGLISADENKPHTELDKLSMDEAYESIDWRTVFLVAGMLPLGTAMESTGTAR